jgi:hypothetical protein
VHVRPAAARRRQPRLREALGLAGEQALLDRNASRAQLPTAATRMLGRVGYGVDDARDPGAEQRVDARRRPAGVPAGLERDDRCAALGGGPGRL